MNEIVYKVYFHQRDSESLPEQEIEFMVPLEQNESLHPTLPITGKVRYLFFNLLFNKIEDDKFEFFLNFHFDNYQGDKRNFLRIFKWDIDEIFEYFEIPWREKKLISINAYGTKFYDSKKLIIKDIMPFFEPYDYTKYTNYRRRYKEANYWIENKSALMDYTHNSKNMSNIPVIQIPINEHLRRPIAFCVCLDYEAKLLDISTMTKDRLRKHICEKYTNKGNGRPISSVQKIVNTLFGYLQKQSKEKPLFIYDSKTKKWN